MMVATHLSGENDARNVVRAKVGDALVKVRREELELVHVSLAEDLAVRNLHEEFMMMTM